MTPEEFVSGLKQATLDGIGNDVFMTLLSPPGRKPDRSNQSTADWYLGLSEHDKEHVHLIGQLFADSVFFGVLVVLDNLRFIEPIGSKGELRIVYTKDGESSLLNDPKHESLHDIYQRSKSRRS